MSKHKLYAVEELTSKFVDACNPATGNAHQALCALAYNIALTRQCFYMDIDLTEHGEEIEPDNFGFSRRNIYAMIEFWESKLENYIGKTDFTTKRNAQKLFEEAKNQYEKKQFTFDGSSFAFHGPVNHLGW